MRLFPTLLSVLLTPLVAIMPLRAELTASTSPTTPGQSNILKIRLADDRTATIEANATMKGYAILVTDSTGLPVSDAVVAMRLPDDGATGYFVNGQRSAVAYTDVSGVAQFPQVNWGSTTGPISVRVTVVKGELHAGVLIEQTVITHAAAQKLPAGGSAAASVSADISSPNPATPSPVAATASPVPSGASPAGVSSNAPVNIPTVGKVSPASRTPGVPTSVAAVHSGASPEAVSGAETAQATDPNVSVVNTAGSKAGSVNTKKWVIVAAVVAGAGLGAALALGGHGGSTAAAATTAVSIGTPTVSVGPGH